jgi:hypothetical protein
VAAVDARGRRRRIRGLRAGGSPTVASSTPAIKLSSPLKMLKLNHARYGLRHWQRGAHIRPDSSAGGSWPH